VFRNILTLCTGNICRSPLAAALLRQRLTAAGRTGVQVQSAGIGALVGEPADDTVQAQAQDDTELAALLAAHRAQQATPELVRWADLILGMEPHHLHYVQRMAPTARGKAFLLGRWQGDAAIADPYRQHASVYRIVHGRIVGAVDAWTTRLG